MRCLVLIYPLAASAVMLSNEHAISSSARVMRDQRQKLDFAEMIHARGPANVAMTTSVAEPSDVDDVAPATEEDYNEDYAGQEEDDAISDGEALKVLHDATKNLPKPPATSIRQTKHPDDVRSTTKVQKQNNSVKLHDISGVLHPDDTPEIPRIIHHVYKVDISNGPWPHDVWKTSYAAWTRFYPAPWYTHMFWDDVSSSIFFLENCPKQYSVYRSAQEIVRADLIRYCILKTHGGIYADLDYEPRMNFYSDLDSTKVNLVQSPYKSETFQNSLMASRSGHPYWDEVLEQALMIGPLKQDVLSISGPGLLESINKTFDPEVINPLPCNSFQRATHLLAREFEAATEKHCMKLSIDAVNDRNLKGIHWGTVSWMNGNSEYMKLYKAFHST